MTDNKHAGIICPPPLMFLAGVLLALALDRWAPLPIDLHPVVQWSGAALLLAGVGFNLWGAASMLKARTPINPYREVTTVVGSGPFGLSRNPLYVGLDLIFVGLFLWLGNPWGLLVFIPLVIGMHYGVILREERYLEERFGRAYREYRERVRRYL